MQTLALKPGTGLQLQFHNREKERMSATLLGYHENHSLIISAPKADEKVILFQLDQSLTVRFFQDTKVFAFESKILAISNRPYPHLHIAWPQDFVSDEIRKAQRVDTQLQAGAIIGQYRYPITILDLSTQGAKLISDCNLGEPSEIIDIMCMVNIEDILRVVRIKAHIRSKQFLDNTLSYSYGVQFEPLLEEDRLSLTAYIYAQMLHLNSL